MNGSLSTHNGEGIIGHIGMNCPMMILFEMKEKQYFPLEIKKEGKEGKGKEKKKKGTKKQFKAMFSYSFSFSFYL